MDCKKEISLIVSGDAAIDKTDSPRLRNLITFVTRN